MSEPVLPYFDLLLAQLAEQNAAVEKSFGRHVHWGYWDDPAAALCDDEDYAQAAERLTLELCDMADIAEGDRVLDVGCGFGGTIASLNESFGHLELAGLNIVARQLARARQQVQPRGENRVALYQGDPCALPFPDASFDRLLSVECIFHFPSRAAFFDEVFRVLRPGGVLALSDFVPSPLFQLVGRLSLTPQFSRFNIFGRCNVHCTIGQYRRLAAKSGLVPVVERNVTRQILPTYRYLARLLERNPAATDRPAAAGFMVGMLRVLGVLGLLNYYLLSFRKP